MFQAILRLGGNSFKVECDDWYGRDLDAKQRDDNLKYIKVEKRLSLVEEKLAEMNEKLIESEQAQSKESTELSKESAELRKELAEMKQKFIELEQELSNPVPKNIRGKY